jgi:hypothetical protein
MVEPGEEFYIVDQGDGWWHCPSPIRCTVLDGPGPLPASVASRGGVLHLLVATEPAIEWNGDPQYIDRWGPDHPLCHPIEPTNRLIVLAVDRSGAVNLDRDWSIPASPVTNGANRLQDVQTVWGLGSKVAIRRRSAD